MPVSENALVLITPMIKVSIQKQDLSKFLDLTRITHQMASLSRDEDMMEFLSKELNGYKKKDKVPDFRILKNKKIRKSIDEIIYYFEKNDDNVNAIIYVDGVPIRLRQFKYLLIRLESLLWEYVGHLLSQASTTTEFEIPKINLDDLAKANLPPEAFKVLAEAIKERDESEKS